MDIGDLVNRIKNQPLQSWNFQSDTGCFILREIDDDNIKIQQFFQGYKHKNVEEFTILFHTDNDITTMFVKCFFNLDSNSTYQKLWEYRTSLYVEFCKTLEKEVIFAFEFGPWQNPSYSSKYNSIVSPKTTYNTKNLPSSIKNLVIALETSPSENLSSIDNFIPSIEMYTNSIINLRNVHIRKSAQGFEFFISDITESISNKIKDFQELYPKENLLKNILTVLKTIIWNPKFVPNSFGDIVIFESEKITTDWKTEISGITHPALEFMITDNTIKATINLSTSCKFPELKAIEKRCKFKANRIKALHDNNLALFNKVNSSSPEDWVYTVSTNHYSIPRGFGTISPSKFFKEITQSKAPYIFDVFDGIEFYSGYIGDEIVSSIKTMSGIKFRELHSYRNKLFAEYCDGLEQELAAMALRENDWSYSQTYDSLCSKKIPIENLMFSDKVLKPFQSFGNESKESMSKENYIPTFMLKKDKFYLGNNVLMNVFNENNKILVRFQLALLSPYLEDVRAQSRFANVRS